MKRRKLYISILLGLCLCLFTAFFTSCKDEKPTLEAISVSGATEVFIDEFDYADYTITATYSDDSTKTATLTADNLSAEDNASENSKIRRFSQTDGGSKIYGYGLSRLYK